jgi:hypothetical protein
MAEVRIQLLDYAYDGSTIDWDNSVVGELDVTSHSEFPLALTFTIADIKDINSRKGSFSKTFKIPATKNNNRLYKSIYKPNTYSTNNLLNKKSCRILINNLYSILGLLELTSVGGYDKPEYYSCVFFGNNITWASTIGETLLKDLGTDGDAWDDLKGQNTGKDLKVNKTGITSTWVQDNAVYMNGNQTTNDKAVVYPIVSYGDFNPSGEEQTIQILNSSYEQTDINSSKLGYYGFNSNDQGDGSGLDYGNPEPVVDWRPCLWVYDVFKEIFTQAGYTISSNFIETADFKKLLFALPNFKYNNAQDRYLLYGFESRFRKVDSNNDNSLIKDGTTEYFNINQTGLPNTEFTQFDLVNITNTKNASSYTKDDELNDTGLDSSGVYTFPEYGTYDIELNNFAYWFSDVDDNSASDAGIDIILSGLQIQLQTVGESTWNTIEESLLDSELTVHDDTGTNTQPSVGKRNFPNLTLKRYFNKNDKIRLRLKNVFKHHAGTGSSSGGFRLYLFGGSNIEIDHPSTGSLKGSTDAVYNIKFNPEFVEYGQTYDLKNIINKKYKQIDFIKGVSHAFNLQFTTDESSKVIYIEPFDTFYKSFYEALDWTYKVDRSQEIKDVWIKDSFKRDIIFKYKSDSKDVKVEQRGIDYFEEIQDEYPYKETLSNEFERGESVFENPFFAGTFNAKDRDVSKTTDPAYNACLWQEKEDGGFISPNDIARPDKGFEFLPRLLYWKKYSPDMSSNINAICYKYATAQVFSGTFLGIFAQLNASNVLSDVYPQATSINREDINSMLLSYGNVYVTDYDDVNNTYATQVIKKGLYQTYYENMINMLKSNPRVRNLSINLKMKDIVNLDFRYLIHIDGVYWRINKVKDFNPLKNTTTKVELVEWVNIGESAAYEPTLNKYDGKWNNNPPTGGVGGFQTRS